MWETLIRLLAAILGDDHQLVTTLSRAGELPEGTTPEQRQAAVAEALAELGDDDLESVRAGLRELAGNDELDVNLEALHEIAQAVEDVGAELERRAEVAAAEEAERQAALARIRGEEEGDEAGDGDEGDESEDGAGDGDEGAGGDEGEGEGGEEGAGAEGAEQPEPVLAGGRPAGPTRAPRISRVAARGAGSHSPRGSGGDAWSPRAVMRLRPNLPGINGGEEVTDVEHLGNAFAEVARALGGEYHGPTQFVPIARLSIEYPESRQFGRDADANTQRLRDALGAYRENPSNLQALTAAGGGLCAPLTPVYDLPWLAEPGREYADGLPTFQATRGGITYAPPPNFVDLNTDWLAATAAEDAGAAFTQWTMANDAAPGDDGPATKPCAVLDCPDTVDAEIYAITRCIEVSNVRARTWPEQIENFLANLQAAFDRWADQLLIASVTAASKAVTTPGVLGAYRDVLYWLEAIAVAYRSRYRMAENAVLDVKAPSWLRSMMRSDLMRELPGSSAERLSVANATIDGDLAARNLRPVWSRDMQVFGAQPAGAAALDYPGTVTVQVHPPGTFLRLDAGELDFGMVRDSALNERNVYRIGAESFENVAHIGHEALAVTMDVCPNGATSGTIDPAEVCTAGS